MTRFLASTCALMLSIGASASTGVMFPKSITIQFGGMQSDFPAETLYKVRGLLASEIRDGLVKFYQETEAQHHTTQICVEARWEILKRLETSLSKIVTHDASSFSMHALACHEANNQQPVLR